MIADPKPRKRHRADRAEWSRIRDAKFEAVGHRCEMCKVNEWEENHHLVPRSQSGDDVVENLMALCGDCHRRVTANQGAALMLLRWSLTASQTAYVVERKGEGWLEMKYPKVMVP